MAGAAPGQSAGANNRKLPARELGRTGVRAPILEIGCGQSWWSDAKTEKRAMEVLEAAANLGITYFDTGQGYGGGLSEEWIGKFLKRRRKEIFLAAKISVRDPDETFRETERRLQRLQTDQIDVLHPKNGGCPSARQASL